MHQPKFKSNLLLHPILELCTDNAPKLKSCEIQVTKKKSGTGSVCLAELPGSEQYQFVNKYTPSANPPEQRTLGNFDNFMEFEQTKSDLLSLKNKE